MSIRGLNIELIKTTLRRNSHFGNNKINDITKILLPITINNHVQQYISTVVIGSNILAVLPGRHYMTQKDKIVIITANYDTDTQSKSPGVNDNGSGVAAIMELARLLKQHKKERCERLILIKQVCEVYKNCSFFLM